MDFDWNQMRAFLATVDAGSLSGGARELGVTQPTLSRQITALEEDLGLLLFERVGKRLHLTQSGAHLAAIAKEMAAASDKVALAVSGQSEALDGVVRITTIDVLAAFVLPPIVAEIHAQAPGITIEVIASNSIDDLMRRQADIAIRHVEPDQPDLIARRCPDSEIGLYAAKSLLEQHGNPQTPQEAASLPFIGFPDDQILIDELATRGVPLSADTIRWRCASSLINWELIRAGYGFGIGFREAVPEDTQIVRLLPDMEPIRAPMWLVAHRELHLSKRIRLVFDALYEGLRTRGR